MKPELTGARTRRPSVLVLVERTASSIKLTGRLEASGVATFRVGALTDAMRVLREAGSLIEAILIDSRNREATAVREAVLAARVDLPLIQGSDSTSEEPWTLVAGPETDLTPRLLETLRR
jgi:hypothetical protein